MRQFPPEVTSYLANNSGVKARQLLWIVARNRTTGNPESIGLWTGEDNQVFTIDGTPRTYYGCGQFISFGKVAIESNLNVQRLVIGMTPISPEMEQVFRGYDAKMAECEAHEVFYSTETNNLIAPPDRFYKGWIDKLIVTRPQVGGSGEARLDIVSSARILTNRLAIKRSNDSQIKRQSGDTFFLDVNFSGQVQTPWGSNSVGGGVRGAISSIARLTANKVMQSWK